MTDEEHASKIRDLAVELSTAIAAAMNDGLFVDVAHLTPYENTRIGGPVEYVPYVLLEVSRRTLVLKTSTGAAA